jgi:hypothetical protein
MQVVAEPVALKRRGVGLVATANLADGKKFAVDTLSGEIGRLSSQFPMYPDMNPHSETNLRRRRHVMLLVSVMAKAYDLRNTEANGELLVKAVDHGIHTNFNDMQSEFDNLGMNSRKAAALLLYHPGIAYDVAIGYINRRIKKGVYAGMVDSYQHYLNILSLERDNVFGQIGNRKFVPVLSDMLRI